VSRRPFAIALVVGAGAIAANGASLDFARGAAIDLQTQGEKEPAYRLSLPEDVYRWSTRDDLGDVRVLDGAGAELPYAVRVPPGGDSVTEWIELPTFALPVAEPLQGSAAVNIELGSDGTVVAVHGAAPVAQAAAYLIDASRYERPIDELEIGWDTSVADVFVATGVSASNDLTDWRTVLTSTTLAALTTNGQSVKLDRIAVPALRAKYLKLGFDRPFAVTSARARSREPTAAPRASRVLEAVPRGDGFEFDTGGRFPIDRVGIELSAPTYLIEGTVYTRADEAARWQEIGHRAFYRATAGDTVAESDMLPVIPTHRRYWRVELGKTPSDATPRLRIGWIPQEIVFVVQGGPPYQLVYGHGGIAAREWPIADLLNRLTRSTDLGALPVAVALPAETLGGRERLAQPEAPIDWRTVTLWGVLVLGVGIVAGLALRLIRQGRDDPPPPAPENT
jgi:hypothetical protein